MRTVQIEDARGGISHHTETFYLQNKESITLPLPTPLTTVRLPQGMHYPWAQIFKAVPQNSESG